MRYTPHYESAGLFCSFLFFVSLFSLANGTFSSQLPPELLRRPLTLSHLSNHLYYYCIAEKTKYLVGLRASCEMVCVGVLWNRIGSEPLGLLLPGSGHRLLRLGGFRNGEERSRQGKLARWCGGCDGCAEVVDTRDSDDRRVEWLFARVPGTVAGSQASCRSMHLLAAGGRHCGYTSFSTSGLESESSINVIRGKELILDDAGVRGGASHYLVNFF